MMFKKVSISSLALAGAVALLAVAPAMAANETEPPSGSVALTNATITPFASKSVGGGTWNYGTKIVGNQKHVWSIYDHNDKVHKSSTKLGSASHTSGWKNPGVTATSELYGDKGYTGYAYWDTK
jgi:Bacteriocin (Lactococcin_972)